MKTVTKYECEVCGKTSKTRAKIENCEAQEMETMPAEVGDLVTCGSGYGWWNGDKVWFHEDIGDPDSKSHHERLRIGRPIFLVVGKVPKSEVAGYNCAGTHHEALILYSPSHANYPDRHALLWTSPQHCPVTVLRSKPELLAEARLAIKERKLKPNLL